MNIRVREATLDDAQLIAELTRAAWAGKVRRDSSGHRETRGAGAAGSAATAAASSC